MVLPPNLPIPVVKSTGMKKCGLWRWSSPCIQKSPGNFKPISQAHPKCVDKSRNNENIAFTDSDSESESESESEGESELDKIRAEECKKVADFLAEKENASSTSYPPYRVCRVEDHQVAVKCPITDTRRIHKLLVHLVQRLGWNGGNYDYRRMILQSVGSSACWTLSLFNREEQTIEQKGEVKQNEKHEGPLLVGICKLGSKCAEIVFEKGGSFSLKELKVISSTLKMVSIKRKQKMHPKTTSKHPSTDLSVDPLKAPPFQKTVNALEAMGVIVFGLNKSFHVLTSESTISWDHIAGYEEQKREIEDTMVLSLRFPEVYEAIAQGTRTTSDTVRPRAVLFEGPPGTGKTSCARVIANQVGIPLLCVPLEVIASKYYGESENLLAKVFLLADEFPNGSLIFLDEVDSLATNRDSETNEATRRVLAVLLHQIDGFKQNKKRTIIAATNRKEDLDPALMSRFDSMITFGLPDEQTRAKIAYQYAQQLTESELDQLAAATQGMSGRDIRDVCLQAERRWASKIIRRIDNLKVGDLPDILEYLRSAQLRRKATIEVSLKRTSTWGPHSPHSPVKWQRLSSA